MGPKPDQSPSKLRVTFLVLRCQMGDESAFRGLYEHFESATLRYLISVVGRDLAKDVQQEAWMSVLRKIKGLNNPKTFKPWLYGIVRNAGIDHLRKVQRDQRLFEYPSEDSLPLPAREGPEAELDLEAIQNAISRLSPIHQEIVVLKYWEGFSYAEMALVTGVPIGSVRSRLFHAKAHLRQLFQSEIDPY